MLPSFIPTRAEDAEALVAIRIAAMRPSLMAAGRFDPERARMRFLSSFEPGQCFFIMGAQASEPLGFFSLRRDADGLTLQHLYLLPAWQGSGCGGQVLRRILACADRLALPVRVGALRGSDANRFYQRHGFVQVGEEEWDIHYLRPASTESLSRPALQNACEIRFLGSADLAPLESILRQHVRDLHSGEVVEQEVQAILGYMQGARDDNGHLRSYLVTTDANGAVAGCMAIAEPERRMREHFPMLEKDALELLNVFVDRQRHGQGTGRRLLAAICADARAAGAHTLIVNSGPRYRANWGFYDRCFDHEHGMLPDYYGPGRDARCWSLNLRHGIQK